MRNLIKADPLESIFHVKKVSLKRSFKFQINRTFDESHCQLSEP